MYKFWYHSFDRSTGMIFGNVILQVKTGDEVYVMYELDDWAFVTCLEDTSRQGYIPIDYCLPIENFFYDNPSLKRKV